MTGVLTQHDIADLIDGRSITAEWPWNTDSERTVDGHIRKSVASISRCHRLKNRTEYDHYGSGYASFVDCWLYRANDDFRAGAGHNYDGLVVLISRLSHYCVMFEGAGSLPVARNVILVRR